MFALAVENENDSMATDEVAQFAARHSIGSRARLALALSLYTGARRSDLVQLGGQHVRNGWSEIYST